MKKITAILLVVALVAVAVAGSTMAYFTDTDQAVNVSTVGNVKIQLHEQERAEDGSLQPFTQGKPAFPAVGTIAWDTELLTVNGTGYKVFDDGLKNVIDKIVTVENTGKSDAYVRTIIALEAPDFDPNDLIHINYNDTGVAVGAPVTAKIDGVEYVIFEFTYTDALPAGQHSAPSLMQYFLDSAATNEYAAQFGETWEILVYVQAAQTAGFDSAAEALNTAFGAITADNHPWLDMASNDLGNDGLKDALQGNEKTIVVSLTEDVTYDVAAWAANGMGGENTDLIVINGNGHTITFNQTNSDWNNIVTNGAKLVINNAHITNAGRNDGPWNRHDLNFACEVELNNVTSDKALAFKSGATLNYVAINDANGSDTYAIWIQPNGQTVTLNNVLIDMLDCSDGRGIKIDEQYVAEPKHVTLNVSNTTFKTEEKSAILVKSIAGATINLDNVNIYGVAADPVNAVWIDEDAAAHADLVTVTGGTKVIEGDFKITSIDDKADLKQALNDAVANGETEIFINAEGKNINLYYGLNASTVPAGTTVTILNANFNESNYGNAVAGTVVFENCTFENPVGAYSIHFDAGNGNVVFNNCTLAGWCSFGAAIKSVEMNNCTLLGNGFYAMYRFYQDTVMNNCTIDCSNSNTSDGYPDGLSIVYASDLTLNGCTLIYCDFEADDNSKIIADGTVLLEVAADEYKHVLNENR